MANTFKRSATYPGTHPPSKIAAAAGPISRQETRSAPAALIKYDSAALDEYKELLENQDLLPLMESLLSSQGKRVDPEIYMGKLKLFKKMIDAMQKAKPLSPVSIEIPNPDDYLIGVTTHAITGDNIKNMVIAKNVIRVGVNATTTALALKLALALQIPGYVGQIIGTLPALGMNLMAPALDMADYLNFLVGMATGMSGASEGTVRNGISIVGATFVAMVSGPRLPAAGELLKTSANKIKTYIIEEVKNRQTSTSPDQLIREKVELFDWVVKFKDTNMILWRNSIYCDIIQSFIESAQGIPPISMIYLEPGKLTDRVFDGVIKKSGMPAVLEGSIPGKAMAKMKAVGAAAERKASEVVTSLQTFMQGKSGISDVDKNTRLLNQFISEFRKEQQAEGSDITFEQKSLYEYIFGSMKNAATVIKGIITAAAADPGNTGAQNCLKNLAHLSGYPKNDEGGIYPQNFEHFVAFIGLAFPEGVIMEMAPATTDHPAKRQRVANVANVVPVGGSSRRRKSSRRKRKSSRKPRNKRKTIRKKVSKTRKRTLNKKSKKRSKRLRK